MLSRAELLIAEMDRQSARIWEAKQQILDLDKDLPNDVRIHRMILLDHYQSVIMDYTQTVAEWHEELRDMDKPILWLSVRGVWRDLSLLFSRGK